MHSDRTASGAWLASRPDPIPAILRSQRTGRLQVAAALTGIAIGTIVLVGGFRWPVGWFYVAVLWIGGLMLAGNFYTTSLKRPAFAESATDLLLDRAWATGRALLVAFALWGLWDMLQGHGFMNVLNATWLRFSRVDRTLESPVINLIQLACLWPWVVPLRETWRLAWAARDFERQLCPAMERRIARQLRRGRRMLTAGREERGREALAEAEEWLGQLAGYAQDLGILYHRQLVRARIDELLGRPVRRPDALDEPSGPSTQRMTEVFGDEQEATGEAPRVNGRHGSNGRQGNGAQSNGRQGNGKTTNKGGYEEYREFLDSLREEVAVNWDQIAGLDHVVSELKTALALSLARTPDGVTLDVPRRILLYGPPGTGKTLLTAAVSQGFDAPFYNVKVSDVLSKFFGESTRLLSALFELAQQDSPAVLFFDEIESISGSREGNMDGEERRMVSALLAQLDGLKQKARQSGVFTIAATNMPWQLDAAILSRFEKQFYVPLPDAAARERILKLHLDERGFKVDAPLHELVRHTDCYSGRELAALCREATRLMLADANPKMATLADRGLSAMSKYRLKIDTITTRHLGEALHRVRPQTERGLLARYEQWRGRN